MTSDMLKDSINFNFENWLYLFAFIVSISASTLGTAVWFSWWLAKQFTDIKNLVYKIADEVKEAVTTKLEYHEQHDDKRFSDLNNNLWELRLRTAAQEITKEIK